MLLDPKIHAYLRVTPDLAHKQARRAEREIMAGNHRGAMHGIPYGAKDVFATAGIATTGHSKAYADFVPPTDATAVAKLERAGAVLLGKLSTHECAHGGPSFDLPWPPARNPWNLAHFTGGSASGAAAGVAAGLLPAALGTDTGGSVRIPAALCGVVGLRPSQGALPTTGVFPLSRTLDTVGPMAASVADTALLWSALCGRPSFSVPVTGLRVGVV